MTHAYITGATGAIGMALVGELLKNKIATTVFLRDGSARNSRMTDCFGEAVDSGLLRLEYVSLEQLASYKISNNCEVLHKADTNTFDDLHKPHVNMTNNYDTLCKLDVIVSDICNEECSCERNLRDGDAPENSVAKEGDVFYHLGWCGTFGAERNDATLQQKNIEYTLDAVRLAKRLGCVHFVGVGSQAEYGRIESRLTPDTPTAPENEYGKAKLRAGIESRKLCEELGIRHTWVRVLSVYGPFDGKNTMIMSVIRGLISGQRVPLTKGEQMWNYLYSEDAARALFLIGETGTGAMNMKGHDLSRTQAGEMCADEISSHEESLDNVSANGSGSHIRKSDEKSAVYCLAGNSECELREYILKLCRTIGADEGLLGFGDIPYGERQVMYLTADIERLTKDTGFIPETTFDDGIKKTVDWVRASM